MSQKKESVLTPERKQGEAAAASEDIDELLHLGEKAKEKRRLSWLRKLRFGFTFLFPQWTPLFMFILLFLVVVYLNFLLASKGVKPDFVFYGIYLGISGGLILLLHLARAVWHTFVDCVLRVHMFRLFAVLMAVLDPHMTYLIFTVIMLIFWANAMEPIYDSTTPTNPYTTQYYIFHKTMIVT